MKQLLLLNIIIVALSTSAQAATINVIANEFLSTTTGTFTTSPSGSALSTTELADIVTNDAGTYVMSNDDTAFIDLAFGSHQAISGAGTDLVIFTVGNGYDFGLQVFDTNNSKISDYLHSVPIDGSSTAKDDDGNLLCVKNSAGDCGAALSATSIDLFGIADNTKIGYIRLFIGTDSKFKTGDAYPLFSLAGAVHTVPLPLPILLFSSGLALLGWFGHRKSI